MPFNSALHFEIHQRVCIHITQNNDQISLFQRQMLDMLFGLEAVDVPTPLGYYLCSLCHRLYSRQVSVAPCTEVAARQSWAECSSRPTTGAEQRLVRWIQCLTRKWSCVNFKFQFHTKIACKPTCMTHDQCYILLFIIGTDIKLKSTNSSIHSSIRDTRTAFHFRQWLGVCAEKIGASYFGNLFCKCLQGLCHACHIWYSEVIDALTHKHLTRAGPVRIS